MHSWDENRLRCAVHSLHTILHYFAIEFSGPRAPTINVKTDTFRLITTEHSQSHKALTITMLVIIYASKCCNAYVYVLHYITCCILAVLYYMLKKYNLMLFSCIITDYFQSSFHTNTPYPHFTAMKDSKQCSSHVQT